jgi:oligopeptidase A
MAKTLTNPLLEPGTLPAFSKICSQVVQPAIAQIIGENRDSIAKLTAQQHFDLDNLVKPLSLMNDRLDRAWSPVRHLNSVLSSPSLREAYDSCLPLLSEYSTELGQNSALYRAFLSIAESTEFKDFSQAQQKAISDALRDFRLGGVELDANDRARYQQLQTDLSALQSSFENNLLDATQAWQFVTENEADLQGLPEYALALLRQLAEHKEMPGYRVTLDMPCYLAVITYADDRNLRKSIYEAYVTRASDYGITDKIWDNAHNMGEIVAKRQEKAKLLGFRNYVELSLETKMAANVEQVVDFLQDLARRSRQAAIEEVNERQAYAELLGFSGVLDAWDYAYYSEKLKQYRYQISDQDLKPYFSDDQVIEGLFDIVARLYRLRISRVESGVERWHESVGFYQIQNREGEVIGQFFLDLYARENKRGGAWMDECVNRFRIDGRTQLPVAYLTCNLTPPLGDAAALFTHDEVITLFHEFGHGLHHMLTRIDVPEVAGINGVEWDAVELPSQFMENYCWEREALDLFARHHQTGAALPDELYQKMIAAKNFQSALQMLRQIEFSLFDIRLHQHEGIASAEQIQVILNQVRDDVSVLPTPAINRFQNSFSHIFAGGYAAGYYSYKWAEVLSADAFAAFEEEGIFNQETGQRFLQCVLEKGGSQPAMESFRCFRGREPEIDALLKHCGINSR